MLDVKSAEELIRSLAMASEAPAQRGLARMLADQGPIREAERPPSVIVERAFAVLEELLVKSSTGEDRHYTALALANLGIDGIQKLVKVLHSPKGEEGQQDIVDAIARRGSASVGALVGALSQTTGHARIRVVKALGQIGPSSQTALPQLMALLENGEDRATSEAAAWAIGQIGEVAVPGLIRVLEDAKDDVTRVGAAKALTRIGSKAVHAVDALHHSIVKLSHHDDAYFLIEALGSIGLSAVPALSDLVRMTNDEVVRLGAAFELGRQGPAAASAVYSLAEALKRAEDLEARWFLLEALGRLEQSAAPAVPVLIEQLSLAEDDSVRWRAGWALGRIGALAVAAIGAIDAACTRTEDSFARKVLEEAKSRIVSQVERSGSIS